MFRQYRIPALVAAIIHLAFCYGLNENLPKPAASLVDDGDACGGFHPPVEQEILIGDIMGYEYVYSTESANAPRRLDSWELCDLRCGIGDTPSLTKPVIDSYRFGDVYNRHQNSLRLIPQQLLLNPCMPRLTSPGRKQVTHRTYTKPGDYTTRMAWFGPRR